MKENIKVDAIIVPSSEGAKAVYQVKVYGQDGLPKDTKSTTDYKEARDFFDNAKLENPSYSVNGNPGSDPFEDGSMALTSAEARTLGAQMSSPLAGDSLATANNKIQQLSEFNEDPNRTSSVASIVSRERRTTPARDYTGWCNEDRDDATAAAKNNNPVQALENINVKVGIGHELRSQPMINRTDCAGERIIRGHDNNAFIVIGNDRVSDESTGYGGGGNTQCDAIDIVAGMGGHTPLQTIGPCPGDKKATHPNFFVDAARIYLSQKTDVDKNFGIGNEDHYFKSKAKSAAVVKADNVRLVGRESLKLITNTDAFNSKGGKIRQLSGIHLIANNDEDDLQPMVKGDNLQAALLKLTDNVESLAKILHGFVKYQMEYNSALQKHVHVSPFAAKNTVQSFTAIAKGLDMHAKAVFNTEMSILKQLTNLQSYKMNHLVQSGPEYIGSRYNKTN
jgi:hypothetical protein